MNSQDDKQLGRVLRQWRIETPLPPRFAEQVWTRIERNKADAPISLASWLAQWWLGSVAKPALAVGYAVVLLVVGLAGGALQAHHQNARLDALAQARYLQSIDPYQK